MGTFSIWHWVIVLVVVLLLFGRGKIPELMGDVAKGIKNFKKGMGEDDSTHETKTVEGKTVDSKAERSQGIAADFPVPTPGCGRGDA